MVPEINLTPQQYTRFAERFPGRRVVAMHSGLTPAQRLQHWLAAHLGLADLVVGTRMAVFASLPRLGLIVVDEEHDASYKQQEGARYSARDLAVMRGRLEQVPVLLGSATPSLETWHNALPASASGAGRYQRLDLPQRIGGGAMPVVRMVDWGRVKDQHGMQALRGFGAVSPPLLAALRERQDRGEQSLVLLNRRGYAPVLHCAACGWKSACRHCSAWRVFHKLDRTLRCHHCGDTERVPRACPECGNVDIEPMGRGTERLEEQLGTLLPGARVARIDADTTRRKGELEAQLASVHAGEVDVLVGTQMIAKGHDFRRITLVAAVNPDSALFSSDFRAPERLFALLLQAAGRAGRDADVAARSEMWVQTWHPQHALYQALCAHDYPRFRFGPARGTPHGRPAALCPPGLAACRGPHPGGGAGLPGGGGGVRARRGGCRGLDDLPGGAHPGAARGECRALADAAGVGLARGPAAGARGLAAGVAGPSEGPSRGAALGGGRRPSGDLKPLSGRGGGAGRDLRAT